MPAAHIEACMRTWDMFNPFPEELNRCVVSRVAQIHAMRLGLPRQRP